MTRPGRGPEIGVGSTVTAKESRARIVRFDTGPDGLLAVLEAAGERFTMPARELFAENYRSLPETTPASTAQVRLSHAVRDDLGEAEAERLITYVRHLVEAETGDFGGTIDGPRPGNVPRSEYDPDTRSRRERLRSKVQELQRLGYRASERSLYRHVSILRSEGPDGLVHGSRGRRSDPLAGFPEDAIAVARRVARDAGTASSRSDRALLILYRAELEDAGIDHRQWSGRRLKAVMQSISSGHALDRTAKQRRSQAGRPKAAYGSIRPTRPGEYVQLDVTPANILCYHPVSGWIRPDIVTAIDLYDHYVLALRLAAGSHSARDTTLALFDAMRPVVRRSEWVSGDERLWHGQPLRIVLGHRLLADDGDNLHFNPDDPWAPLTTSLPPRRFTAAVIDRGSPFNSHGFLGACAQRGIDVIFARPYTGSDKGHLESFHSTLADCQQVLLGHVGRDPSHRGDAPEEEAVYTIFELEQLLHEWVSAVYHHRPQSGLRDPQNLARHLSPHQMFELYLATGGWVQYPQTQGDVFDFLLKEKRKIGPNGVKIDGAYRYDDDDAFGDLKPDRSDRPSASYTFHYDPYDRGHIYFFHPLRRAWMEIPEVRRRHGVRLPYSSIRSRAAIKAEQAAQGDLGRMSPAQLEQAEVTLARRWRQGEFADLRERRLAAVEQARAELAERDREEWRLDELLSGLPAITMHHVSRTAEEMTPVDETLEADFADVEDLLSYEEEDDDYGFGFDDDMDEEDA